MKEDERRRKCDKAFLQQLGIVHLGIQPSHEVVSLFCQVTSPMELGDKVPETGKDLCMLCKELC